MEGNFDALPDGCGLPVWAKRGTKAPSADGFDSFLVKPETEPFSYADFRRVPIRRDYRDQKHGALILGFYSFIGELRLWAVEARWAAVSAGTGIRKTATRSILLAGAESIAIAASDTVTAAVSEGIAVENLGKGIAPVLRGDVRHFQIGIADQRRIHLQLGIVGRFCQVAWKIASN